MEKESDQIISDKGSSVKVLEIDFGWLRKYSRIFNIRIEFYEKYYSEEFRIFDLNRPNYSSSFFVGFDVSLKQSFL